MSLDLIGDWAAHAAFVGALLFTVGYGALAPWWRSSIGWNMLLFSLSHCAIFGLISVSLLFGVQWGARDWVRVLIFAMIAALFWQRNLVLITSQIFARRIPENAARHGATHRECPECGK